jgi:hypothetical protein
MGQERRHNMAHLRSPKFVSTLAVTTALAVLASCDPNRRARAGPNVPRLRERWRSKRSPKYTQLGVIRQNILEAIDRGVSRSANEMKIVARYLFFSTVLAGLHFMLPAYGAIYKWVDAQGVVQYSSTPPLTSHAQQVDPPKAPAEDPKAATEHLRHKLQAFTEHRAPQAQKAEEERKAQAEQALKQQNCKSARWNLEALERRSARRLQDPQGNIIRLTEQDRQERIDEARKQIENYCDT